MHSNSLQHYGILGMKWGIRRTPEQLGHRSLSAGVRMYKDGRIEIDRGTNLKRLSRDRNIDPMHRTYATVVEHDILTYVSLYGRRDGRDYVVSMSAKEDLVAPSTIDATRLLSELLVSKPEFRESFTRNDTGKMLSEKELSEISKNPTGRFAQKLYMQFNIGLGVSPEELHWVGKPQDMYVNKLLEKGYTLLLDENDFRTTSAVAPVIVLDPYRSLSFIDVEELSDKVIKASGESLKNYQSLGERFIFNITRR